MNPKTSRTGPILKSHGCLLSASCLYQQSGTGKMYLTFAIMKNDISMIYACLRSGTDPGLKRERGILSDDTTIPAYHVIFEARLEQLSRILF